MIVLTFLLTFSGSFALYNASQKAALHPSSILEKWFQTHSKNAKLIGVVLLIIAAVLSSQFLGISSGLLFWLFTLTLTLSAIVILTPLKKINYKSVLGISILLLIFELIF